MSPELDKKLCEKYPKIFANRNGPPEQTAMCWGFECGDGWYNLIDKLCDWLQFNTDSNNHLPKYANQVVAVQVKEKFGGLRFYVDGASDVQDAAISFAESMSYRICDVCGAPGKPNGSGWIRTRCEEHRDAM